MRGGGISGGSEIELRNSKGRDCELRAVRAVKDVKSSTSNGG